MKSIVPRLQDLTTVTCAMLGDPSNTLLHFSALTRARTPFGHTSKGRHALASCRERYCPGEGHSRNSESYREVSAATLVINRRKDEGGGVEESKRTTLTSASAGLSDTRTSICIRTAMLDRTSGDHFES